MAPALSSQLIYAPSIDSFKKVVLSSIGSGSDNIPNIGLEKMFGNKAIWININKKK